MPTASPRPNGGGLFGGAGGVGGSDYFMWREAQRRGMPRWAWWGVVACAVLGTAATLAVYVAARSFLAASVVGGVFWLAGMVLVNFGVLTQRARSLNEPPRLHEQ